MSYCRRYSLQNAFCRVYLKEKAVPTIFNAFPTYLQNICIPTLPTDLCLKSKNHLTEGYAVCSVKDIPIGIKFGPYKDAYNDCVEQDKKDFQFQVEKKGEMMMILDGNNEKQYSWLQYVNYATSKEEQNLITFQDKSEVYYVTCKFIPANTELLVWHQGLISEEGTSERKVDVNSDNQFEEKTDVDGMEIILSKIAQDKKENILNNICGKAFSHKSTLSNHENVHTGEKFYKYNICGEAFSHKSSLVMHHRIHTAEKPYRCNICGKTFAEKSNLVIHQKIHTGKKLYKCNICGKALTTKPGLSMHQRIHTGEKLYKCNICGKPLAKKSSLATHQRIHAGEKPYKCNICRKAFAEKSSLTTHLKIHSGEKPYKCNTCLKNFIQKSHLVYHERIHTGEKPYKCSICGIAFTRKSSLTKHQIKP